jgi:signal transduction histidine kinase
MGSLPLRIRLTLPFAVAMAAVLVAMGAFVYFRLAGTLIAGIDQSLRVQAAETVTEVEKGSTRIDLDPSGGPVVGEILTPGGRVVAAEPAGLKTLLGPKNRAKALDGHAVRLSADLPGLAHEWRLLAVPVKLGTGHGVFVTARSLTARNDSLHRLRRQLMLAIPLALLLAIGAGYALAAAALRPVEAMRRRAAAITASTPGRRLPVPAGGDELTRLAETLNDMLDRLEAAFEHERRFLADASHELRTPLALLRTELELALRRPRTHEELVDAIRSAAEETERMTKLAQDILLLARSDEEGIPIRREQIPASLLLERIAGRFASRAAETGRDVAIEAADDVMLNADPERLEQAIGNLVDNSFVYGRGTITLSARAAGPSVELHVTDEGDGFPEGFAGRAFDRFSRADEGRSPGGTGLGLAIVELIAVAHGGTAAATNRAGGGADVWLTVERGDRSALQASVPAGVR